MLAVGRYVDRATDKQDNDSGRGQNGKMIISSKTEKVGEGMKMFTYETVKGVVCVELRITEDNARDIYIP